MKTRLIHFVLAVYLIIISGRSVWSQQSSLYFSRPNFVADCQLVPGNQQNISFFFLPPFAGPSVTISDVTFTGGSSLTRKERASGTAMYNFDSGIPLRIHFANGARAFGADFSSLYNAVPSFTATLSLDNGETFNFTAPTDPNFTFFGFISPTPIMNLTFSDGGIFPSPPFGSLHEEMIANVFVVTVPEPAGIALAGLGAALLFGWRSVRARS